MGQGQIARLTGDVIQSWRRWILDETRRSSVDGRGRTFNPRSALRALIRTAGEG
jgi:hypothetical protein